MNSFPSKAHSGSEKFIIDPLYSASMKNPPAQELQELWLYNHYDYEAFVLERMFREKNEAKLKVGYTKFRRTPASKLFFKTAVTQGEKSEFYASGNVKVSCGEHLLLEHSDSRKLYTVTFPEKGEALFCLECDDIQSNVPALGFLTSGKVFLCSTDGKEYLPPVSRQGKENALPPHLTPPAFAPLTPCQQADGVWDFGREVIGFVEIKCPPGETPELYVGESLPEAANRSAEDEEQTRELVQKAPGVWESKVLLALRYVQIEKVSEAQVSMKALFHPAVYKGAFSLPGMEDLTQVWMHSAYTLRLCMMNFLVDGIKRDRLPWAGDLAVSLLGNAYSFGDSTIVRDTLSVLGAVSASVAHVNTIVDYTLWFIINHDFYQLYFGDRAFLEQEYPRISETLDYLLTLRDEKGFLRADRPGDWLFIDWVPGNKETALQMIFIMALRSGSRLAQRMKDENRSSLLAHEAEKLIETVRKYAFDAEKGLFAARPGTKEFSRHANLLSLTAKAAKKEDFPLLQKALTEKELPPVGTPYCSVFEALALKLMGENEKAVEKIREIWGGMLALGATTFWEGFDPESCGNEHLVFYERPYGKSLCHAWSAGPLFLLPQLFLGIEPVADGWKKFKVTPLPGVTASAAVPTPDGIIQVECVEGKIVKLIAPKENQFTESL